MINDLLTQLGIPFQEFTHPPLFTTADSHLAPDMPGVKNKNLFLRNRKGDQYFMISLTQDKQADLKKIADMIRVTGGLSFASPERLKKVLRIEPGCVGILSLVNDTEKLTTVYIDEDLLKSEWFQSHPDVNTTTICFKTADLTKLIARTGHQLRILSMA